MNIESVLIGFVIGVLLVILSNLPRYNGNVTTIRGKVKIGLRGHPGVPVAALFTLVGMLPGVGNSSFVDAMTGGALMSVFWIPVLITAYKSGDDFAKGDDV